MRHVGFSAVIALALTVSAYAQTPTVQMIEIGTPEPGSTFRAVALNRHGVVLGNVGGEHGVARMSVYTWTRAGGFRFILGSAEALDFNDRGTIVGIARRNCGDSGCEAYGFMWTPSGGVRDLGDFWPYHNNEKGSMAGVCRGVDESWCARIGGRTYRFSDFDNILDMNERDVVVGFQGRDSDGVPRALLWAPALGRRDLDPASGPGGVAYAINDGGMIVGQGRTASESLGATIWTPLGRAESGDASSIAYGISNRGWIVGRVEGRRPALWLLGRRLVRLPMPADAATSSFNAAEHVNDAGHIVGHVLVNGRGKAIFWIVQ